MDTLNPEKTENRLFQVSGSYLTDRGNMGYFVYSITAHNLEDAREKGGVRLKNDKRKRHVGKLDMVCKMV